jgi:hypothetical protein
VQTAPGHDVGLVPQDAGRGFLGVHQLIEADGADWMIEKQIDVGVRARLITGG